MFLKTKVHAPAICNAWVQGKSTMFLIAFTSNKKTRPHILPELSWSFWSKSFNLTKDSARTCGLRDRWTNRLSSFIFSSTWSQEFMYKANIIEEICQINCETLREILASLQRRVQLCQRHKGTHIRKLLRVNQRQTLIFRFAFWNSLINFLKNYV